MMQSRGHAPSSGSPPSMQTGAKRDTVRFPFPHFPQQVSIGERMRRPALTQAARVARTSCYPDCRSCTVDGLDLSTAVVRLVAMSRSPRNARD